MGPSNLEFFFIWEKEEYFVVVVRYDGLIAEVNILTNKEPTQVPNNTHSKVPDLAGPCSTVLHQSQTKHLGA